MKNIFTTTITLGLLLFANVLFSQEKIEISDTPIDNQFEELLKTSRNYYDYKVIKKAKFIDLQQNTRAKIAGLKRQLEDSKNKIESQKGKIGLLKDSLKISEKNLNKAKESKDQVAFLGIQTKKGTYRALTWGIILILLVAFAIFFYKFKDNHVQTQEAKKNLKETEDEFEEYRKTSLEKQQELGRKLQDERNKLKEDKEQ